MTISLEGGWIFTVVWKESTQREVFRRLGQVTVWGTSRSLKVPVLFKVTTMTDVTFKAPVPDHSDCQLKWRIWSPPGQYLGFLIIAIYNIPTNIPTSIFLQMLFFSEPLICSSTGTRPTRRSRFTTLLKLVQLPPPANNGWHFLILTATATTNNNPGEGGGNNASSSEAEVSSVNNDAGQHQHDHNLHNYNNDEDHHQVLLCRKSMTKRSTSSSLSLRWSNHNWKNFSDFFNLF